MHLYQIKYKPIRRILVIGLVLISPFMFLWSVMVFLLQSLKELFFEELIEGSMCFWKELFSIVKEAWRYEKRI